MANYLRIALWYLQGSRQYGRRGFEKNSKDFSSLEDAQVNGWSFMVTGGSTGIGRAAAEALIKKRGTSVHIVCKNPNNGNEALNALKEMSHPESKAFLHIVDLSEPHDVINFTKEFVENNTPLNVLINNAGILATKLEYSRDGFDRSFSLNVLGTYLLTEHLAPHLISSSKNICRPRVVLVTSGGMYTVPLVTNNLDHVDTPYDGVDAYAKQKRQQVVLNDILSDKFPEIHFSSMHPGWVDTPGVRNNLPGFFDYHKNDLRSPEQGADTIVWLAVSPDPLNEKSGTLFFDRKPAKKFIFSNDLRYNPDTESEYFSKLQNIVKKLQEKK